MAKRKNIPEPMPPSAHTEDTPAQTALSQQQKSCDAIKKELYEVRQKIQQGESQIRQRFGA